MKETTTTMIVSALVSVVAGCASFQMNKLSPVSCFPKGNEKKTLSVNFNYSRTLTVDGVSKPVATTCWYDEVDKGRCAGRCVARLNESGLFASVLGTNASQSDFILQVDFNRDSNRHTMDIPEHTGFLIPGSSISTYSLSAVLMDTKSTQTAEIRLEDGIKTWGHIAFLPVLLVPSLHSPDGEAEECQNKLFDHLALEISETGMLR